MNKDILKAKWFWVVIGGIFEIILLLLVFRFGVVMGIRRANFNEDWGRNYGRFFGEPKPGFFVSFGGGSGLRSAFGNAGTVISMGSSTIVIKSNDNNEKTIAVDTSTVIRAGTSNATLEDIHVGDPLVVIGEPSSTGAIEAKLIRIFPADGPVMLYRATGTSQ